MKKRHKRRKRAAALLVGLLVLSMAATCYADNALHKLGRGLTNASSGWLEVPKAIYEESKEHNPLIGLTYGTGKGAIKCVGRTGVGAFEAGTFLAPKYDETMLEPEYVF